MTKRYVVIGNPVAHSKSPQIHRLFAAQTGQDIEYTTLLAAVDGFAAAVEAFRAGGGNGANVTVPFKEQAFRLSQQLTPRARAAGAVNTLTFNDDGIVGDNTDGAGLVRDIEHNLGFPLRGRRVLLLGAGGAARGVMLPLLEAAPASLTLANRSADKARQLAAEFSSDPAALPLIGGGYAEIGGDYDLVINATAAGLTDAALPLAASAFAAGSLAYDMMYGRDTPFLRLAASAGATCSDGLGMLVEQAAEAFFVWLRVRPDSAPVLAQLRAA